MTYREILASSANLLNDAHQTLYTNAVLLPFFNMALKELQEYFELSNIPVTNETSSSISLPAGTTRVGFNTLPTLPIGLVEIQRLYESPDGQDIWTPMVRRMYLTDGIIAPDGQNAIFGIWAWIGQSVRVPSAINIIDIKLDYIRSLFTTIVEANLDEENIVINTDAYMFNRTAALAAEYLGTNKPRGDALTMLANEALERSLGISVKGQQAVQVRRRPFREQFKRRRMVV